MIPCPLKVSQFQQYVSIFTHINAFVFLSRQQIAVPRNDEWTRFVRTLAEINENRDDAEELAAQRLSA